MYTIIGVYYKIRKEYDDCPLERFVDTIEECRRAAKHLGLTYRDKTTRDHIPVGCVYDRWYNLMWFNTIKGPSKTLSPHQWSGVCRIPRNLGEKVFLSKPKGKMITFQKRLKTYKSLYSNLL